MCFMWERVQVLLKTDQPRRKATDKVQRVYSNRQDRLGGVAVYRLPRVAGVRGFDPRQGHTKDFNSFSAELFKVDSSMFKTGRLHFSCNTILDYFDN